jgi:ketosteroid isomerase-like protein
MRHLLAALSALLVPAAGVAQTAASATRAIADRYVELTFARDYDGLMELYADDAVFFDPTADVFPEPMNRATRGAADIVALQKSWGLADAEFAVEESFAVGEFALYRGELRVTYAAAGPWIELPFVTVLRVQDGRVSERTDFAEYVESFGLGDGFDAAMEGTAAVASAYLEAYLAVDLQAQQRLLAPDATFEDPTARVYGPGSGERMIGRDDIVGQRGRIFQTIKDFDLDIERSFVSNHHAVFMGTTSYTVANGNRFAQPAVFVVEVHDNRVTRHWDFVDYSVVPGA